MLNIWWQCSPNFHRISNMFGNLIHLNGQVTGHQCLADNGIYPLCTVILFRILLLVSSDDFGLLHSRDIFWRAHRPQRNASAPVATHPYCMSKGSHKSRRKHSVSIFCAIMPWCEPGTLMSASVSCSVYTAVAPHYHVHTARAGLSACQQTP